MNTTTAPVDVKPIIKGSVVSYKDPQTECNGWYRVTKRTKNLVNLGAVWGGKVYFKSVPVTGVKEDEEAQYTAWTESEAYRNRYPLL